MRMKSLPTTTLLSAALLIGCGQAPPAGEGAASTAGVPPNVEAPPAAAGTATAAPAALPQDLVVSTNEPFWQATVEGGQVLLRGPDVDGRRFDVVSSRDVDGTRTIRATDADGAIDLRVRDQACQDDMSGADFPYRGELAIDGGAAVRGCARPASMPPPGETGADTASDGEEIPARFHGRWATDAGACERPEASIEGITIEARALRFHESIGVPQRVERVDADTVRITSAYSGEGEEWSREQTLHLVGPDTLELAGPDGVRLRRLRCD